MKDTITLNNGLVIPTIGYGTFKIDDIESENLVKMAVKTGYRHIDTASYYKNELGIGKGIAQASAPREDIFLATKIWMDDLGYEKTMQSFEASMEKLGLDYLDLLLIHWPRPLALESWKALEELYHAGKVKAIGVCNYNVRLLQELLDNCSVKPVINQIECHPKLQQTDVIEFCQKNDIAVEAWSPIMKGQVLDVPLLQELGEKYGKSPVQITLRWHLQRGVIVIPKASSEQRMLDNRNVFDFSLTDEEMAQIATLNEDMRLGFDPEYIYKNGFDPARDLKNKK